MTGDSLSPQILPTAPCPPSAMPLGASTTFYAVSPLLYPTAALVCLLPIFPAEALGLPYPTFGTSSPHTSLLCPNPAPPLRPHPQVPQELRAGAGAACQLCETGGWGGGGVLLERAEQASSLGPSSSWVAVLGGSPSPEREPQSWEGAPTLEGVPRGALPQEGAPK